MDSSTDAPSHLSDSEFWRLCHDLPSIDKGNSDDPFPSAITIATKNSDGSSNPFDGIASILEFSNESDEGIDPKHSEESDEAAQSSSDDSLHNLYAKKNQANDLFIESHANCVNTQRIYETIELIGDNSNPSGDTKFNSLTSDESSTGSASTTTTTTSSASNADDLLIKIAKNLKQLKEDVAEIATSPKMEFSGDLIDFNDDSVSNDRKSHQHNGSHFVNEGLPSYVPYANRKNDENNEIKTIISSPATTTTTTAATTTSSSTAAASTRTNVNVVTERDPNPSNNSIVCLDCCNEWTTNDKQKPNTTNGDDYDNKQPFIKPWCSNCSTSNCNNIGTTTVSSSSSSSGGGGTSSSSNSSLSISEYDDFASNLTLTKAESVVCNRRSCIDDVTSYCAYSASDGIHVTTTNTNTCTKCHCTDGSTSSVSRTEICAKIGASDKDACAVNIPIHARVAVTHTISQPKVNSSIDNDDSRSEKDCVCVNDEGSSTTTTAKTSTVPFIAAEPANTSTTVRILAADDPRIIKEELLAAAAEILSDENKNCVVVVSKDTKPIRRANNTTTSEKNSENSKNSETHRDDEEKQIEKEKGGENSELIEKHHRHGHSSSHLSHRRLRNAAAIRKKLLVKSVAKNRTSNKKCRHSRRRCRCVVNLCDDLNANENDIKSSQQQQQHLKKVKTKKSVDDINVQNQPSERVIKISNRSDASVRGSEKNHRRSHRYSGAGSRQTSSNVTLKNDLNRQQDDSTTNGDHFESSNRLRRLEERFKDIAITKKIVQQPEDNNNREAKATRPGTLPKNANGTTSSALVHGRTLKGVDDSIIDVDDDDVVATSDSNNNHIDARLQHHKSDVDPTTVVSGGGVKHKENRSACHTFSPILGDVDGLTTDPEQSEHKSHSCCQHVTVRKQKNNRDAFEERRGDGISIFHGKFTQSSTLLPAVNGTENATTTHEHEKAIENQKLRKTQTVPRRQTASSESDANRNQINVDVQIERCSSDRDSLKADLLQPSESDTVNLKNKSHPPKTKTKTTKTTTTSTNETSPSNEVDVRRFDPAKQTINNNLEQITDNVIHKHRPAGDDANGNVNVNKSSESVDAVNVRLIDYTPESISTSATTDSDEISNLFPDAIDSYASHLIYYDEIDDDEGTDATAPSLATNCAFDVRDLAAFGSRFNGVYECYDELESSAEDEYDPDQANNSNRNSNDTEYKNETNSDTCEFPVPNEFDENCANRIKFSGKYCECTVEAEIVPVYRANGAHYHRRSTIMRDISSSSSSSSTATAGGGTLRGLLKKPNRPPPLQKNRVIFDETRNEFFDADYIILIRDDCPYDEEDEEPCTCGEHELVRLCCDEGCQCTAYADDTRTPQSPKYTPPIEFVDQAALSPPEGYKDGGANLQQALGGALGGHIFGAQHIQQLQVIQRLQAQRAAMLAARATAAGGNPNQSSGSTNNNPRSSQSPVPQVPSTVPASNTICTECAECSECAAKQEHDDDCISANSEETIPVVPHVALLSIQATSPERRFTQKEIIAGEERPKYLLIKQHQEAAAAAAAVAAEKARSKNESLNQKRYVVETITMTTVTERRIVHEETNTTNSIIASTAGSGTNATAAMASHASTDKTHDTSGSINDTAISNSTSNNSSSSSHSTYLTSSCAKDISLKPNSISAQITGILKGGKLWKSEQSQCEDSTSNVTSDDDSSKRSVRFIDASGNANKVEGDLSIDRDICDGQAQQDRAADDDGDVSETASVTNQSTLFHNALRPNSAVRQLFPTAVLHAAVPPPSTPLTHEALRAFEESKRTHLKATIVHSDSETDSIRRTIERNALRRSLIKYEPKKKPQKPDISLEERIRQLTCNVDEPVNGGDGATTIGEVNDHTAGNANEIERRDSPAGEENPQQSKYVPDKSFSPISSASSSSSSSLSAYRKITDIFHKDKRQERIPEADENPIVIIPQQLQDCRCPSAPDLGMGVHMPATHTQIHQTPPRQGDSRRQFLSTLAPLTSCVAGQRDDMSFYSLAAGDRTSTASSRCSEYSLGDIEAVLQNDETKKVAPDVIAGTPGQEQDELAAFAQQEANRTERIKKRYSADTSASAPGSNAGSDDDEQNDYGFNKRPSVRGIKPRFHSTNEILQQMQAQLSSSSSPPQQQLQQQQSIEKPQYILQHSNENCSIPMQPKNVPPPPQIPAPVPQTQQQQAQQIAASVVHQQTHGTHTLFKNAYYQEQQQRNSLPVHANPNYYPTLPVHAAARHSFQEESTIYQNCQSLSMEQHYGQSFAARSPTRRPESPPPLRNYHQTMVLIPYNTESYAHFSGNETLPNQAYRHHNILEYQQVTQQTIRVPIGYPLPGMQLHVVTGNAGQHYAQYTSRQQAQLNASQGRNSGYAYGSDKQAVKYTERGAPEGAASVSQSDCNAMIPVSSSVVGTQASSSNNNNNNNNNNTQTSTTANAAQGAVFYAMNV